MEIAQNYAKRVKVIIVESRDCYRTAPIIAQLHDEDDDGRSITRLKRIQILIDPIQVPSSEVSSIQLPFISSRTALQVDNFYNAR